MSTRFVVITGGPGAGKTAVLEMAKKRLDKQCAVLPEAASLIFSGGFWRLPSLTARMAAQRAIFHVQDEMEKLVVQEGAWKFALCDRGTIDGLAYWPGSEEDYWSQIGSDERTEFSKYEAIIHLRTPDSNGGYNLQNVLRTESAEQAREIDLRIERAWCRHVNYIQIPNFPNFLEKALSALKRIEAIVAEPVPAPPRRE
jgi:predicted ATPase